MSAVSLGGTRKKLPYLFWNLRLGFVIVDLVEHSVHIFPGSVLLCVVEPFALKSPAMPQPYVQNLFFENVFFHSPEFRVLFGIFLLITGGDYKIASFFGI